MKEGLSNLNQQRSNPSEVFSRTNNQSGVNWSTVRVLDIILDENHPMFDKLGGYSSIGTVIFQNQGSQLNNPEDNNNYASPLFPNNSQYPLINEIILIVNVPVLGNNVSNKSKYYYVSSVNLWNTPHHNALPNETKDLREHIDKDGNVKLNLTSNYYEGNFEEKNNINPLKNFPGDIIYEGRNNNSIRLGSTFASKYNNWSRSGKNGDPILILKNGSQSKDSLDSWIPITEDINIDDSSIYLTSSQQIPIKYTSNFSSLKNIPLEPSQYNKPQIIISSERLLLNAKKDGILINGEEFVHINSKKNIGINSNYSISLNSNAINLGSYEAREQMVLGNKLMKSLANLTEILSNMADLLSEIRDWPGGSPSPSTIGAAINMMKPQIDAINDLYNGEQLLSKIVKTD